MVIVEEAGITAAATRLLRSQPTISAALGRLEARVGSRLIDRGGGAFRLTAAGRELYGECAEIYDNVSRLEAMTRAATRELTGNINIFLASHVITPILDHVLAAFHRQHPQVTFRISVETSVSVAREVLGKSASLGICLLNKRLAKLDYQVIYREYFGFFCGPPHPLFGKNDLTIGDLRDCCGVSFETDSMDDALRPVALFRSRHQLDHNIVGRSPHLEEVRRMIICGLGIGPLPIHVVRQDHDAGALWRLPPYDDPPSVDVHLVTNPARRPNRAEAEFIKTLRAEIAARTLADRTYSDAHLPPVT